MTDYNSSRLLLLSNDKFDLHINIFYLHEKLVKQHKNVRSINLFNCIEENQQLIVKIMSTIGTRTIFPIMLTRL